jgi:hypothetical protein
MAQLLHILDWLSVAALAFMSYGIVGQWLQIRKLSSIREINLREVAIRWTVTAILMVKLALVGDPYLIVGQLLLLSAVSLYIVTLLRIKHLT